MTTITLDLPDALVKQAQDEGLLSSAGMTALLRQALEQRQSKNSSLVDIMQNSPHKEIELIQPEPEYSKIRDMVL